MRTPAAITALVVDLLDLHTGRTPRRRVSQVAWSPFCDQRFRKGRQNTIGRRSSRTNPALGRVDFCGNCCAGVTETSLSDRSSKARRRSGPSTPLKTKVILASAFRLVIGLLQPIQMRPGSCSGSFRASLRLLRPGRETARTRRDRNSSDAFRSRSPGNRMRAFDCQSSGR